MQASIRRALALAFSITTLLLAQEPAVRPARPGRGAAAAVIGSGQDPAAVERGAKLFATNCAGCHGPAARGGPGAPDLIRSIVVLNDEKGILIAPVIRNGRPEQGMPKSNLTEPADRRHRRLAARTDLVRRPPQHLRVSGRVTGDAKKGEAYFNGAGGCNHATRPRGDLKGIGARYDAFSLQQRWLQPRGGRGGGRGGRGGRRGRAATPASTRGAVTVTVTPVSGKPVNGLLERIDDFSVSLRDASGDVSLLPPRRRRAQSRNHGSRCGAHSELLHKYTDADIHNVTAYLVSLK